MYISEKEDEEGIKMFEKLMKIKNEMYSEKINININE